LDWRNGDEERDRECIQQRIDAIRFYDERLALRPGFLKHGRNGIP